MIFNEYGFSSFSTVSTSTFMILSMLLVIISCQNKIERLNKIIAEQRILLSDREKVKKLEIIIEKQKIIIQNSIDHQEYANFCKDEDEYVHSSSSSSPLYKEILNLWDNML
jgi:hypothetical protein